MAELDFIFALFMEFFTCSTELLRLIRALYIVMI